ncbi:MAG: lytic transglycosylase domain-containing protein [Oscillospiraceae bacterium]
MTKKTKDIILTVLAFVLICVGFVVLKNTYKSFYLSAYPLEYKQYVKQYSEEYNVDEALIYAVIRSESSFDANAVSEIGARGLMQITDSTFEWAAYRMGSGDTVTYDDMFDPELNIRYGTYILSLLLKEFGSPQTALAAYHAGWGSVKGWLNNKEYSLDGENLDNIPFWDTKTYVPKVMETMEKYKELYGI